MTTGFRSPAAHSWRRLRFAAPAVLGALALTLLAVPASAVTRAVKAPKGRRVIATISVAGRPSGVAVSPLTGETYATAPNSDRVYVIGS
jgi:DNA-binding beta-propeller fold protein YncE